MRRSDTGILTTHVGALPPPVDVWGNQSITDAEVLEAVLGRAERTRKAAMP
jgi:hypothetical protein